MKKHTLSLLFTASMLLSSSCSDNDPAVPIDEITIEDIQLSTSVIRVERLINECEFIARSFKTAYPNQPGILTGATITSGLTEEGKTKYDIVFANITGPDNKKRNGKLTVVFENAIENGVEISGKHLHVRSDEEESLYTVEGVKFKGSLVYSNIARRENALNNIVDHLNAQSSLYIPNEEEIRFSSRRKSKWMEGSATTDLGDDVFEITGQDYSLAIVKAETKFALAETQAPLTLKYACAQSLFIPIKGATTVAHVGGKTRYLFFGEGHCTDKPVILPK
ncbi:hypothetical protein ACFSJU_19425 [Paradesertivirga mongoliensis]|uniref:Lipoprotein n=1 Tax=Paradesertivirga mongoliensis TaxID=2100740 RepID=A0ABW4ZRU7_9SPHI|nr:hypothetical protein [Pedobacter mongoliensis]